MAKLSSTHIFGNLVVDGNINGNADTASKVNNGIKIQLNGGTTENTSQFTFDGSITKNINITPLSIGAATTSTATTSANGLMSSTDKSKLDGIATNANNYSHPTTSGNKHIPSGGSSGQILRWSADGTAVWGNDNNTTYSTGTASTLGLTKLYTGTGTATDGTMTQNAINTALNGKANSSHGRHIPDACTIITDWNSATTNGWYMGNNATNAPTSGSNVWYFGEVVAHNTNYIIQTVYQFTASADAKAIPKYIRAKTNGIWGAWTNVTVAKAVPSNAVFTDTNTWRGVQDNLTSTATDQSLSANQGKVLKGLIDGKANSSHTHNSITNQDTRGVNTTPTQMPLGLSVHLKSNSTDGLNDGGTYHSTLMIKGWNDVSGGPWAQMTVTANNNLYFRSSNNDTWNAWKKVSLDGHTHNYAGSSSAGGNANAAVKLATARTINGTSFDGSANITTANWGTARTLTIGNSGKSVNGSANVSWSLSEIGALPTNGGTMTGNISFSNTGTTSGTVRGITATTGDNDGWRIVGGQTAANAGYLEIATMDDNSEPIYVRQYTGAYATLGRTATLLGSDGSTSFPVKVTSPSFVGALTGNASTATKATQDSAGQQINKTYIKGLSVSGKTITYTKGDGTTGTITTQDTNTTYSTGTASALGLTKLYTGTGTATDGTMTQAALKTTLDGKANSGHTHTTINSNFTVTDQLFKYKGITPSAASLAFAGSGGYDYVQGCNISIGANPDISSGIYGACLIGYDNTTQIGDTFIVGARNESYDTRNFIFGCDNVAETYDNFIIGQFNTANSAGDCYIFGSENMVGGNSNAIKIVLGSGNTLNGNGVAIGRSNNVNAYDGAAIGYNTKVFDDGGYAIGYSARAHAYQLGIGHYGNVSSGARSWGTEGTAFVIGNGGGDSSCSNACRITYAGAVIGKAAYASSGADYAEYFEWLDGNPNNEDRVGYFVTMEGDKIKIAKEGDYLLGVVSGYPAVIGNNDMEWQGQFLTDDFGRPIKEKLTKSVHKDPEDENSEIEIKEYEYFALNPNYNPNEKYIHREDRPEWDTIGMLGVLSVYDDGTCKVNGYCKCNNEGIATTCERGFDTYRVIKRVNDRIVKIIFNIK